MVSITHKLEKDEMSFVLFGTLWNRLQCALQSTDFCTHLCYAAVCLYIELYREFRQAAMPDCSTQPFFLLHVTCRILSRRSQVSVHLDAQRPATKLQRCLTGQ